MILRLIMYYYGLNLANKTYTQYKEKDIEKIHKNTVFLYGDVLQLNTPYS